jgi:hypothetical protein
MGIKKWGIWQFFQDGDGAFSAMRLAFIGWTIVLIAVVLYDLVVLKQSPKLDLSLVGIYATVMTGKAAQSFSENSTPTVPKPPQS